MKVQTSDDAKLNNGDEKPDPTARSSTSASPYTIDYEIKPAPQAKYVNLSKLVLLILAIIATFLACLIFARDLWGHKNGEKVENAHHAHHAPRIMGANQNRFPFDDFMDDIPDPIDVFGKDDNSKEEEPKVIKSTKISFTLLPKGEDLDGFPGFGSKKIGFGPDMDDPVMEDVMKMVMNLVGRPDDVGFGDLPFFEGPNRPRPVHPKLIIVKRFPPPQQEGDVIKNFLSGFNAPHHHKPLMEPFPLFPVIRPVHRRAEVPEVKADSLITKIMKDFAIGGPSSRLGIKIKPKPEVGVSAIEGWTKYKELVSKLAQQVDVILDAVSTLKETVVEELNKMKEQTQDQGDDGAPKTENPAQEFLSSSLESLNKIGIALTEVSVVIKTEDGAMDLIHKTDKDSLVNTVESFLKELNVPLGEVFSTSTALTKMAGKEGVSQPVLQGIVGAASKIVDFGKVIYEDVSKLPLTVSELVQPEAPKPGQPVPEPQVEPAEPSAEAAHDEEPKMIPFFKDSVESSPSDLTK